MESSTGKKHCTVVVKLMGGLGNQMLQFAAGYCLAKRKAAQLKLDTHYFQIDRKLNNTHREFELGIFHIKGSGKLSVLSGRLVNMAVRKLSILRKILLPMLGWHYLTDKDNVRVGGNSGTWYLDGYWTKLDFFDECRKDLVGIFDFKRGFDKINLELAKKMSDGNSVALHIRRTDYLRPGSIHQVLPAAYFYRAIELVKSRVSNPVFYFFGDDHQWIRDTFPIDNANYILVSHNSGMQSYQDMGLMSQCKHLVISNSTFSWWGAYLNENAGLKISPLNWFVPGKAGHFVYDEFIPQEWIRL